MNGDDDDGDVDDDDDNVGVDDNVGDDDATADPAFSVRAPFVSILPRLRASLAPAETRALVVMGNP